VTFSLYVLAMEPTDDIDAVRAMIARCDSRPHPERELDERIVAFYEELTGRYPDFPPFAPGSPWANTPLDTGVDHIWVSFGGGSQAHEAFRTVYELAVKNNLIVYDPQAADVSSW
jgi:hypothetical protein